ncbi:hypothetical protein LIER_38104 [Lithospermum erythrorhizon]|uniref:Uncharacterized protein n=1 Tax=Lithospermum erythrorhizon TaxID=34254 RepID=A0AAV3PXY2_LITER
MSSAGGPDGKPAIHSLGSKCLHVRVYEEASLDLIIFLFPSPLNILLGLNKKKDKVIEEPTGDVYNPRLQQAYEEYLVLFREEYGEDTDRLRGTRPSSPVTVIEDLLRRCAEEEAMNKALEKKLEEV